MVRYSIRSYYAILAVEKGCDDGAVKKAYRKVSRPADGVVW